MIGILPIIDILMYMMDNLQLIKKKKESHPLHVKDLIPLCVNQNQKVEFTGSLLEREMISKLKAGDISAFTNIFSSFYKDLVVFVTRFTKDLNIAEEKDRVGKALHLNHEGCPGRIIKVIAGTLF